MTDSIHYHYLIGYVPEPRTEKFHIIKQVFVRKENFTNDKLTLNTKSFKALLETLVEKNTQNNEQMVSYEMIANWELNVNRLWRYDSLEIFLGENNADSVKENICRRILAK